MKAVDGYVLGAFTIPDTVNAYVPGLPLAKFLLEKATVIYSAPLVIEQERVVANPVIPVQDGPDEIDIVEGGTILK